VGTGFLLVLLFGSLSNPTVHSLLAGAPVSLLGLALRAWAAGHLAKNQTLATTGPYSFVRNPLYVGTAIVAAGLVIASRSWILAAVFTVVFVFVYLPVIQLEEQHLRKLFPTYSSYAERVPLLVPRMTPSREVSGWSARLYVKNEEWQAFAGYVAGIGFLVWKALTRVSS